MANQAAPAVDLSKYIENRFLGSAPTFVVEAEIDEQEASRPRKAKCIVSMAKISFYVDEMIPRAVAK